MLPKGQVIVGPHGSARSQLPIGGRAIQRQRRQTLAQAGHGPDRTPGSGSDDPLKSLDLKNLNELPLAKLSETANAVWERIRSSGINVKVNPSSLNSQLLPPNLMPGGSSLVGGGPSGNGATRTPGEDASELASTERTGGGGVSGGKEQRLMAALAQAQEEKRQLADRSEMLRAQLGMLESKNSKMAREVESADAGRSNALRLRDLLLEERDSLAVELKEAREEIKRSSDGMEAREGALEALRQSQHQLQDELKDAVTRLQAVDKSTEELRSQLTSLESSRAAAAGERDDMASHLRELVGRVEQLSDLMTMMPPPLMGGGPTEGQAANGSAPAASADADRIATAASSSSGGGGGTESSVAAAAAQLQQLRATTEGAFAALRVARDELGLMRAENQQLAQRAESLAGSNHELAAAADTLKQQMVEVRTELDEQRSEAAELRSREAELRAELETSVSERSAAAAAVAAATAQRDELAVALAQLSAVRDAAAVSGLGLVELAKMGTQITALKEQLTVSRASETDLKRRLATSEVALLDSRRAAAAAEARLVSERDAARRDAAELRATLHARSLAAQAARRAGVPLAPAEGQFLNVNRFWVPADVMYDFVKAVAAREVALVEARGFLGIAVRADGINVMVVSSLWAAPTAYEDWCRSDAARRHHYPTGIYQYAPRRGEGFPEDYLPFKDVGVPAAGGL